MPVSPGLIGKLGESNIGAEFKQDVEQQQAAEAKQDATQIAARAKNLSTLLQHGDLDDASFNSVLNEFVGVIPSVPGSPQLDPVAITSNREEFTKWLGSLDTLKKKGASAEALEEAFSLGKQRFGGRAGFAGVAKGVEADITGLGKTEEEARAAAIRTGIPAITTAEQGADVAAALEAGRLPKEAAKARTEAQRITRDDPATTAANRIAVAEAGLGRKLTEEETRKLFVQDPFGVLSPFEEEVALPTDLPSPKGFKGKTVRDPDTGKSFRSDGKTWTEI